MKIPADQIDEIRRALCDLVDERTSAPWAEYSDEELAADENDREEIERIRTISDVIRFLRDRLRQTRLVEWTACLDPLNGFRVAGKEVPDENDEDAFRAYLVKQYGIKRKEMP